MPIRFVLVCFLACASVAAQDLSHPPFIPAPVGPVAVGGFRPASVEVQFWDGTAWEPGLRTLDVYDEAGRLTEAVEQTWKSNAWVNVRRTASEYDSRDSLVQTVREEWADGAWAPVERSSYTYDAEGRRSLLLDQAWEGETWVDVWRYTFGYGEEGEQSETMSERYEDGVWAREWRSVRTRDDADRTTERRTQGWDRTEWEDWSRVVTRYDDVGQVTEERFENWNSAGWANGIRRGYTYDASGLVEMLSQSWVEGAWRDGNRQTREYDASGRLERFAFSVWVNSGAYGQPATRTEVGIHRWAYRYDDAGNLTEVTTEGQKFDASGWSDAARFLYTYERATDTEAGAEPSGLTLAVAPNPSMGRAEVSFEVATPQTVRVAVHDALGREVAVLADGPRVMGAHRLTLDRPLPSGVYVVRVAGETATEARPLTIIR